MKNDLIINPVTGKKNCKIVREIFSRRIIDAYWKNFNLDVSVFFKDIEKVYLCKCKKTNYMFFYPFSTSGDGLFYSNLQSFEWYYQQDKWEFGIAESIIKSGSLLEIGCGNGDFLTRISNKSHKLVGIEQNKDAIKLCKAKGFDVDTYKLENFNSEEFDYITCFQVLEHLTDIKYFFEYTYKLLKLDGRLIIGVPNNKSLIFNPFSPYYFEHGSLLLNIPPHHMGWWDKQSICKVGKYFNFKVEKIYFEPFALFRLDLAKKNFLMNSNINPSNSMLEPVLDFLIKRFCKGETLVAVLKKND